MAHQFSKAKENVLLASRTQHLGLGVRGGGASMGANAIDGPCIGIDLGTTYRSV